MFHWASEQDYLTRLTSFFILVDVVNASYEHILFITSKVISEALLLYKVKLELAVNTCV